MKIKEYKFRQLENRLFYISGEGIEDFEQIKDKLPGSELSEGLLVYGHIDHSLGIMFQVLCGVQKSGTVLLFLDANTRPDLMIAYERVAGCEAEPMAKEEVDFSRYMHLTMGNEIQMKMAGREGALVKLTRLNEKLDPVRTEEHPDVVRVTVKAQNGTEELCLIRCERIKGDTVTGTVMNEPEKELGIHQGDRVEFNISETENGGVECVCRLQ